LGDAEPEGNVIKHTTAAQKCMLTAGIMGRYVRQVISEGDKAGITIRTDFIDSVRLTF
jgi:hypothetical protein